MALVTRTRTISTSTRRTTCSTCKRRENHGITTLFVRMESLGSHLMVSGFTTFPVGPSWPKLWIRFWHVRSIVTGDLFLGVPGAARTGSFLWQWVPVDQRWQQIICMGPGTHVCVGCDAGSMQEWGIQLCQWGCFRLEKSVGWSCWLFRSRCEALLRNGSPNIDFRDTLTHPGPWT